jgi:hypothetical protein
METEPACKIIKELPLPPDVKAQYMDKLKHYTFIDDICHLRTGAFIRWIRIEDMVLTSGGLVCELNLLGSGMYITCKPPGKYFGKHFRIYCDDVLIFQKMTADEIIVNNAMQYINSHDIYSQSPDGIL